MTATRTNVRPGTGAQRSRQGFTLPEVLIAIVVLVVGILVVSSMQVASLRASRQAGEAQQATALVRSKMEELRSGPASLSTRCLGAEVVEIGRAHV